MKRIALILTLCLTLGGIGSLSLGPTSLLAQDDPGSREDAIAARQKLLRAADQLDVIQSTSDSLAVQINNLKSQSDRQQTDIENLKSELAALKEENAGLRASLEKIDATRAEERKVLLAEVSRIVAGAKHSNPTPDKSESSPAPAESTPHPDQKGFEYVVVKGDTLHAISMAYKAQGIPVTVADIRTANNMTPDQVIHVGQKLFIPKK